MGSNPILSATKKVPIINANLSFLNFFCKDKSANFLKNAIIIFFPDIKK